MDSITKLAFFTTLLMMTFVQWNLFFHIPDKIKSSEKACKDKAKNEAKNNKKEENEMPATELPKKSKPVHFITDKEDIYRYNILYVLCEQQYFTFKDYLSIKSTVSVLQAWTVTIVFHKLPEKDSFGYNTWLSDLTDDFPFIDLVQMNRTESLEMCIGGKASYHFIENYLATNPSFKQRGIYVAGDTIFIRPLLWDTTYFHYTEAEYHYTVKKIEHNYSHLQNYSCPGVNLDSRIMSKVQCVTVSSNFYPKDIISKDSFLGQRLRYIAYGAEDKPQVARNKEGFAQIASYVRLGSNSVDLTFFLSVLSVIHIQKVQHVYVYTDTLLQGQYWSELMRGYRPYITVVHVTKPAYIFTQPLNASLQHAADTIKARVFYHRGGFVLDPDVIFSRAIPREQLENEANLVTQPPAKDSPFPEYSCLGLLYGAPRSKFAKSLVESLKSYNDSDWDWNWSRLPYKTWERKPWLAEIQRNTQVICHQDQCYPPAAKQRNTQPLHNFNETSPVLHFTFPNPYKDARFDFVVHEQSGLTGELARFVLRKAGRIGWTQGKIP